MISILDFPKLRKTITFFTVWLFTQIYILKFRAFTKSIYVEILILSINLTKSFFLLVVDQVSDFRILLLGQLFVIGHSTGYHGNYIRWKLRTWCTCMKENRSFRDCSRCQQMN